MHCLAVRLAAPFLLLLPLAAAAQDKPKWIELFDSDKLEAWKDPSADWTAAGDVGLDPENPRKLAAKPGKGVFFNGPKGRTKNLVTKEEFQDLEVHVEFLIPQKSNSGVKLMGLYEIQIFDSHGVKEPKGTDCGGIYPRAEEKPLYHYLDKGVPPRVNAAKPAGEWQTLDIVFKAPRFDADGKKTANARFVKVVLNDRVIHEDVEVEHPTGAAWVKKEVARGPLLLQADHGPVAFRNVRVRPYEGKKE
jgi:hypothetical protein